MKRGYIRFSLDELRQALQLPNDFTMIGVEASAVHQSVQVIVEHADVPEVCDGCMLTPLSIGHAWHDDVDKRHWRRLSWISCGNLTLYPKEEL